MKKEFSRSQTPFLYVPRMLPGNTPPHPEQPTGARAPCRRPRGRDELHRRRSHRNPFPRRDVSRRLKPGHSGLCAIRHFCLPVVALNIAHPPEQAPLKLQKTLQSTTGYYSTFAYFLQGSKRGYFQPLFSFLKRASSWLFARESVFPLEFRIFPPLRHQLIMCATFNDTAAVKDEDFIRVPNG